MTDLVTFGETMIRLSPPGSERLELASELECRAAGAESNVAAVAARLGADVAWLSKLPDSPLGRKVAGAVRGHGVDVDVAWSDEGRQGVYFVEQGGAPRGTNVIYDRADAAVTTAVPDELPLDRVRETELFFTSGITPALSATLERTTADLLDAASGAGTTTAFDVNYRSKLWSPERARETLTDLFPAVDVLVTAERDASDVLDYEGEATDVAAALVDDWGFETVVVTRGEAGAVALHDGAVVEQAAFEAETVDPIGTGDAFVGAFLAARLDGTDVSAALERGAAAAALKRTIPGDVAAITPAEVERVRREGARDISR